jgi:hypothetical protein
MLVVWNVTSCPKDDVASRSNGELLIESEVGGEKLMVCACPEFAVTNANLSAPDHRALPGVLAVTAHLPRNSSVNSFPLILQAGNW